MITRDDIRIYKAQDNTDNDSGGGSMTGNEVIDGKVNGLFTDISRVDTVNGDVAMRKIFPAVRTSTDDVYYGAHIMIRKNSDDPRVTSLLVHTDSPTDRRSEARKKVENYLAFSYEAAFYLYGNHIAGMRAITFLSRPTDESPSAGEVYYLTNGVQEQYVRISSVEDREITLSFASGQGFTDYTRKMSICTLTQALDFDFAGSAFHPAGNQSLVRCYHTTVANAVKYHGTKTLIQDLTPADTVAQVDSIYEQLVPSTLQQVPLVDLVAAPDLPLLLSAIDTNSYGGSLPTLTAQSEVYVPNVNVLLSSSNGYTQRIDFGGAIQPGTFKWQNTLVDNATGKLFVGTVHENSLKGVIDYAAGVVEIKHKLTSAFNQLVSVHYKPATAVTVPARFSAKIDITPANAGLVFVKNLSPAPSAASLRVEYRAAGRWYSIPATGLTTLGTDGDIGVGSINYNGDGTATVSLTLGAEPEVGSAIIFTWAAAHGYEEHSGATTADYHYEIALPASAKPIRAMSIKPNHSNVHGEWRLQNGAFNRISGAGSVAVELDVVNNVLRIDSFKDAGNTHILPSTLTVDFDVDGAAGAAFSPQTATAVPDGGGVVVVNVGAATAAGNFYIQYDITAAWQAWGAPRTFTLFVNQLGRVFAAKADGSYVPPADLFSATQLSTWSVNTSTGDVSFHPLAGLVSATDTESVPATSTWSIQGA